MKETYFDRFVSLLTAAPGMTGHQLAKAIGGNGPLCVQELSRLYKLGRLFGIRVTPMTRYFVSAESLEANRVQVLADEAAHVEAKRMQRIVTNRDHNRDRYAKKKAERAHLPKPPRKKRVDAKPKIPKAPKQIVFAKGAKKAPPPRFSDQPAIIPPHVKVQKLPGYTGAPAWELRGKTWQR